MKTGVRGKREREAGKRHRRGTVTSWCGTAVCGPLKLGHNHLRRHLGMFMADLGSSGVAGRNEPATTPPPK